MSNVNLPSNFDRTCYPTSGKHTRFPTLINCDDCNDLTMTDIEYDHGVASYLWCLVLLPCFCTGFCCLCLNSCKDVKHFCSKCRKDKGVCKSDCIWYYSTYTFLIPCNYIHKTYYISYILVWMSDKNLFDRPLIGYDGSKNCHFLITVFERLHPKL